MWDDPELPEGTKVTMLTMRPIAEWVQVRQARGVAAAYGDLAVTSYVASPDNQSSKAAMERDPEIAAALARAQQQVAAFLAADDGTRGSIWSAMSAADRDYLSYRDPQIAAWAQTQAPPDIQAQPATEQPAGQDALDDVYLILDDWTMQAIALQGAWSATDQQIASFTGTEVDASEVEMLEMTWEMSLSDLDALRTAAGEDANRQQLATGLLESGTVFGQALTAYKDAVGEHTLKELQSAGQTFGQWVSSLA
jgi:hypothetical protein